MVFTYNYQNFNLYNYYNISNYEKIPLYYLRLCI